jgi:hypothetical protein
MKTTVDIDGTGFRINGTLTYPGRTFQGHTIEGLLFNSRMIQAIFDDECAETRSLWKYPDTRTWDPDRNTDEFCRMLPIYRAHGLLAVTVGLQGGGSVYERDVYGKYRMSAFAPDGSLKPPYFERLSRVLRAADDAGMVVIVSYFYHVGVARMRHDRGDPEGKDDERVLTNAIENATNWLLSTGYRNLLVEVINESAPWCGPFLSPESVHRAIETARKVTQEGRRLPAGASTFAGDWIPTERWLAAEDFTLPHGNDCTPDELRAKLRRIRDMEAYRVRPRPLLINEDSVFLDNLDAAAEEYASWGFYHQGYGSGYKDARADWSGQPREERFDDLSGYQTLPINWSINDPYKAAFFARVREITGTGRTAAAEGGPT